MTILNRMNKKEKKKIYDDERGKREYFCKGEQSECYFSLYLSFLSLNKTPYDLHRKVAQSDV